MVGFSSGCGRWSPRGGRPHLWGGGARGSMRWWRWRGREERVRAVAFDTRPVELDYLKDGYLSGLIGQKYWGWGYDSVQIIYDHVLGGKTFPPFTDSGMDIVTAAN